jgi:hypothetical protein
MHQFTDHATCHACNHDELCAMQVGVAHGRATLEKEPINKQGKQSIPQLHAMLMQRFHAGATPDDAAQEKKQHDRKSR